MQIHNPESVGMSGAGLQRINEAIEREIADNRLPGILTLVQRHGKVIHHSMHGLMDIEAGKPMQADALFRIHSMTKPIVTVALLMLHEEGHCLLHDPVAKYIPAFAETPVYSHHTALGPQYVPQDPPMTIFHLLTHTSGMAYGFLNDHFLEARYGDLRKTMFLPDQSLQECVEQIAAIPLLFQPGTQWRYSFATDVLGYLIEGVAGMPLADFLEERIFKPLGMVDTAFHVPEDKLDRLVTQYFSKALYEPRRWKAPSPLDVSLANRPPSAGGGLISTASDYLCFCNMLLNGGELDGVRLISRKSVERMTTSAIPYQRTLTPVIGDELHGYGFGLGVRVMVDPGAAESLASVGEYGWYGIGRCHFLIDPQEDLIALFMTQYLPACEYPLRKRFSGLVYQAFLR